MEKTVISCYVDQLLNREEYEEHISIIDKLESAWFIVPKEWADGQARHNGFKNIEHFLEDYIYDNVDGWLQQAIADGVLLGCGAGDTSLL